MWNCSVQNDIDEGQAQLDKELFVQLPPFHGCHCLFHNDNIIKLRSNFTNAMPVSPLVLWSSSSSTRKRRWAKGANSSEFVIVLEVKTNFAASKVENSKCLHHHHQFQPIHKKQKKSDHSVFIKSQVPLLFGETIYSFILLDFHPRSSDIIINKCNSRDRQIFQLSCQSVTPCCSTSHSILDGWMDWWLVWLVGWPGKYPYSSSGYYYKNVMGIIINSPPFSLLALGCTCRCSGKTMSIQFSSTFNSSYWS